MLLFYLLFIDNEQSRVAIPVYHILMNEQDTQLPVINFLLCSKYQSEANKVSMSDSTLEKTISPLPYFSGEQKF